MGYPSVWTTPEAQGPGTYSPDGRIVYGIPSQSASAPRTEYELAVQQEIFAEQERFAREREERERLSKIAAEAAERAVTEATAPAVTPRREEPAAEADEPLAPAVRRRQK